MEDMMYPCPTCGIQTDWELDCPGFGNPVMVCQPPCGGAVHFFCPKCDWWYRTPNRRVTDDMATEPPTWLALWKQENVDIL